MHFLIVNALQVDLCTGVSLWTMNQSIASARKDTGLVWGPSVGFNHQSHFAQWRGGCTRTQNAGISDIPAALKHACGVSSREAMDRYDSIGCIMRRSCGVSLPI